jgi:hypothetical protein
MLEFVSNPEPQLAGGYLFLIIGFLFLLALIFRKSETEPVREDDNTERMRLEKAQIEEAQKKSAAMRYKYFYKNTATSSIEGPFEKHEIMNMLNNNSINLTTLLRKGIENNNFQPLKNFPELVVDVKDFI